MKKKDASDVMEVYQVIKDARSISVSEAREYFIPRRLVWEKYQQFCEDREKTIRCLSAVGKFDDDKSTRGE